MDGFSLPVAVGLREDGFGTVGLLDSFQFVRNQCRSLIPGDTDVLTLAAVLGITLAVGVPIRSLEGVEDAVGGVDALLIAEGEGGRRVLVNGSRVLPRTFIFQGLRSFQSYCES